MCVCVAKPVAVELRCYATALIIIPPVYEVYRGYIVFAFSVTMFVVAAHLRSFFEKVGSLPRVFIVYICAHTFPR